MSFDLTNKNISDTFQNLLQKTGSDGRLYDLKGNTIDNLRIDGTLTANSYITSQSVTVTQFSSGSTIFGDSFDDKHRFTGSLELIGSASLAHRYIISIESKQGNFMSFISKHNRISAQLQQSHYGGATLALRASHSINDNGLEAHKFMDPFSTPASAWVNYTNGSSSNFFGVGTNEPTNHLHVSGNIFATGIVTASTFVHGGAPNPASAPNLFLSSSLVGVHTNTPTKELTVSGSISASGDIYVNDIARIGKHVGISTAATFGHRDQSGVVGGSVVHEHTGNTYINAKTGQIIALSKNLQNRLIIDANDNVGIGLGNANTTVGAGKKLTVQGDISASGDIFLKDGNNIIWDDGNLNDELRLRGTNGRFRFQSGSATTFMEISQSSGNARVGINTAAAESTALTVHGNISASGELFIEQSASIGTGTSARGMELTVEGDISASSGLYLGGDIYFGVGGVGGSIRSSGTDYVLFYSNNAQIPLILSASNVGIGTTSPAKKLTVQGDISASGKYYAGRTIKAGKPTLEVEGNISASGALYVDGDVVLKGNDIIFDENEATEHIIGLRSSGVGQGPGIGIISGSTTLMQISHSNGNSYVGIGTITPTKELTVEGDISASGLLYTSASHGDPSNLLLTWNSASGEFHYTSSLAFSGGGGGGVSFPTEEVISSSTALFIGKNNQHVSMSNGNISASGEIFLSSKDPNSGSVLINEGGSGSMRLYNPTGGPVGSSGNSNSGEIRFVPGCIDNSSLHKMAIVGVSGRGTMNNSYALSAQANSGDRGVLRLWSNTSSPRVQLKAGDASWIADHLHIGDDGEGTSAGDIKLVVKGDISCSNGIYLGGTKRTTWPAANAGDWFDGSTYQSSSLPVYIKGDITASRHLVLDSEIEGQDLGTGQNHLLMKGTGSRIRWKCSSGRGINHNMIFMTSGPERLNLGLGQFGTLIQGGNQSGKTTSIHLSGSWVGINNLEHPSATLHVNGNLWVSGSAGQITASGKISSSAPIYASGYYIRGMSAIDTTGNAIKLGNHIGSVQIGKNTSQTTVQIAAHITASGNISASGTSHIFGGDVIVENDITASGNISASGNLLGNMLNLQGKQVLNISSNRLSVGKNTYNALYNSPNHDFQGHITASGNISASGNLYAKGGFLYIGPQQNDNFITYNPAADHIEIQSQDIIFDVANGVGIGTDNPPKTLTVQGDISASGTLYATSASFGAGTNRTDRWSDGFHGNDEFIPIFPGDFAAGASAREMGQLSDDHMGSIEQSNAGFDFYGTKIIPRGFTATSAIIWGNNTSATHTWYSSSLQVGTAALVGAATAINTEKDISDIIGDGERYVIVRINGADNADNYYGGKIYIKRTT